MGEFLSKPSAGPGSDKSGLNRKAFIDRSRRFQGPPSAPWQTDEVVAANEGRGVCGDTLAPSSLTFMGDHLRIHQGGWAVLLYPAKTEQGFEILSCGKAPVVFEDFEGIWLVKTQSKP